MNKTKILQIGPHSYVGGVSIHIKRLSIILQKEFDFIYIDESPPQLTPKGKLNVRRINDQLRILRVIKNSNIIHIHSGNWLLRIYFIILASLFRKSFVVTLHSYRINGLKAKLTERLLLNAKLVIAVSKEIKGNLSQNNQKVILKEAFIPPVLEYEDCLSPSLKEIIEKIKSENKFLISANAFRLTKFNNGELYGIDQCIGVAELVKKNNLNIHIVFIIGSLIGSDVDVYSSYKNLIKEKVLENFITIIPEKISFVKLIENSDIIIRPTLSDGDAITIREAIFMNKKVIASDIVQRPKGTFLYKTGDIKDLYKKIIELTTLESINITVSKTLIEYKSEYLEIYKKCNNSHKS